jgi:hypothetical protein
VVLERRNGEFMKIKQTDNQDDSATLAQLNARVPKKIKTAAKLVSIISGIKQEQLATDAFRLLFGSEDKSLQARRQVYVDAFKQAHGGIAPFTRPLTPFTSNAIVG